MLKFNKKKILDLLFFFRLAMNQELNNAKNFTSGLIYQTN